MTTVPVLETERLRLRPIGPADFEPAVAFYSSDASRFVGGPAPAHDTWRRVASYAGCWALRGYGKFAVEEKQSGGFAGFVGPWHPVGWPEAEIAWTILPEFQGRGYAQEAAHRALRFVYDVLGWTTAVSCMAAENRASQNVARRLAATCEGDTEIAPYGAALLYRHLSPDAHQSQFPKVYSHAS
jgi:RimJ/RimL family protein N-acetyltransferase